MFKKIIEWFKTKIQDFKKKRLPNRISQLEMENEILFKETKSLEKDLTLLVKHVILIEHTLERGLGIHIPDLNLHKKIKKD